jgi:dehydrogenase/reductase SDR family protein 1
MTNLAGKIAVVTGASRGIGKAIAQELGRAGAVVYLTGRTRTGETPFCQLAGSIDETAASINDAGGTAFAISCDHTQDEQTQSVFEHIQNEQGRLDLLVNNAWAGYQQMQHKLEEALKGKKSKGKMIAGMEEAFGEFTNKFWELSLADWDTMHRVGVRSHYIASVLAARMMTAAKKGLIVNVTADVSEQGGQVAYSMAKSSINRMTADMAAQLREYEVSVVAIQPGMVLTEMFEERYRKGFLDEGDYPRFEAPAFVGKCVAALAADDEIMNRTGSLLQTKEIAATYGLEILDGSHVVL